MAVAKKTASKKSAKKAAPRKAVKKAAAKKTVKKAAKKTPVQRPVSGVEASFDVFCQKERDNVLNEHPDFNDEALLDFCRQQWCMMSKKQKARYKSKYSEESGRIMC